MPPGVRMALKWRVVRPWETGGHLQTKEWEKMLTSKRREMEHSEKHFRPNTNI